MAISSTAACATRGSVFAAFGTVGVLIGHARLAPPLAEDPRLVACFSVAT